MSVFVVIGEESASTERRQAVKNAFADRHLRISPNVYLVDARGQTSDQVSNNLGVKTGEFTGVAVFQITGSYWGIANAGIWAWLKAAFERANG
jgi:hypothetical protein